ENGKHLIDVDHLKNVTRIEFADDCRISINGQAEEEGRKYGPDDLKQGDRVEIKYDVQATSVAAVRRENLTRATLRKINQSAREIRVQPEKVEGEVTFPVGADCEIVRDDKKADFADLREGDVLDIPFEPQTDAPGAARTIDARQQK